jgi:hypothetical protein
VVACDPANLHRLFFGPGDPEDVHAALRIVPPAGQAAPTAADVPAVVSGIDPARAGEVRIQPTGATAHSRIFAATNHEGDVRSVLFPLVPIPRGAQLHVSLPPAGPWLLQDASGRTLAAAAPAAGNVVLRPGALRILRAQRSSPGRLRLRVRLERPYDGQALVSVDFSTAHGERARVPTVVLHPGHRLGRLGVRVPADARLVRVTLSEGLNTSRSRSVRVPPARP